MKCERLDVWKVSARLAADVYRQLANLKDFGFKDQITRAAATQTWIGVEIDYIPKETGKDWVQKSQQLLGMLTNFQKVLRVKG